MVLLNDIMGWINMYVLLVELTFVVHLKMHILVFLIRLNVLVSSHLNLSNMIFISHATKLIYFC
jgi:hypothetical protein